MAEQESSSSSIMLRTCTRSSIPILFSFWLTIYNNAGSSKGFAPPSHIPTTTTSHNPEPSYKMQTFSKHSTSMKQVQEIDVASSTDDDDSSLTSQGSSSINSSASTASYLKTPVVEPHVGHKVVLVTGGAGFIGSSVADYLLSRGDTVVIIDELNDYYDVSLKQGNLERLRQKYDNKGDEQASKKLSIYKGDICDANLMESIFSRHGIQWVCHLAARAGVRPSITDPFVYIHSNIEGTTRLLELAARYHCQNFCFASSSSVYGGSDKSVFSEDDIVDNPVSPYAATKKACELLAYTFHNLYDIPVSGLRFFTVYGPHGRPDMAPFGFIDKVSRNVPLQQYGDGSSSRDYTYISDIVDGVVRSLDRPYDYQIFNLGKGHGTSLRDFLGLVQKYCRRPAIIEQLPDQPGDVPYTCANVEKARYLLGYRAQVPFDEGIRKTVEWYQSEYGIAEPMPNNEEACNDVSSPMDDNNSEDILLASRLPVSTASFA